MKHQRITITMRGEHDDDLEMALREAVRLIRAGNTSGMNTNDTGGFYFDVTETFPKSQRVK